MQRKSEQRTRQESAATSAAFANSQKSQWIQRAAQLRQGIQALYARERDAERLAGAAVQADAVAASRRAAVGKYPDLAKTGSAFNVAFVARYNQCQQQPAYFQDTSWPMHLAEEVSQASQTPQAFPTPQPK